MLPHGLGLLINRKSLEKEESKSKRDTINDECINPYYARLDTLEEIIKLITK